MACRGKDRTAVAQSRGGIEAQPHPFEQRGKGPGIDHHAVGRGLTADRVEPGAVGPGGSQGMGGQGRIEAGNGRRGALETGRAITCRALGIQPWIVRDHGKSPTPSKSL